MNLRAYIVTLHAALFGILLAVSAAGATMLLTGVGSPAAAGPPIIGTLMLEDGTSFLLLEDGASNLCLEGGC